MARKISAKQFLKVVYDYAKAIHRRNSNMKGERPQRSEGDEVAQTRATKVLQREALKSLRAAFKHARLDSENDDHWRALTASLAVAVYGGRGPGRPKAWAKTKLRKLFKDVSAVRKGEPGKGEEYY